jgi:uncharacterized protein YbjT (DUF2867 family)
MSKKILVLGGTGLLGYYAAKNLQHAGFPVRILARNLEKAQGMFDDSFEIVEGNANAVGDVRNALDGCYSALVSLSETGDLEGTRNVAEFAKEAGLEHLAYVSGATVAEKHSWFPLVANKLKAEAAVKNSGLPYTIFCPSWFFEMTFNFIRRKVILGKHPRPYHWLSADDFGRMVAVAYQKEEAHNKHFYMMGPEPLLMHDVLPRICARLYPDITSFRQVPLWMAKLIARATGNTRMLEGSRLMAYFDKIGIEVVGDPAEANAILGAPETTLDQWIAIQEADQVKSPWRP